MGYSEGNFYHTMTFLTKSDKHSFHLLNIAQFLGALNDNIFKLLVVYFLINVQGVDAANKILSIAGAVFVIPFLLFSSAAGVLADKISKRTIIVSMKLLEVVLMATSILAIYLESEFFSFFLLFMMGAQSAAFGPSKYGIIPELIEEKKVPKANGSMTSLTYFAIILGTFLASFLTDITDKNFFLVSILCVVIAIIGFVSSLGIAKTPANLSPKKINPLFLYEIYQTLSFSAKIPHLFPVIMASAFFLFFGAFVQLNIIPFAMISLGLSEVAGGYLFLLTAVGIAVGAWIAGRLSRERIELGLSCVAGFALVVLFFLLSFFSFSLNATMVVLILLGLFAGMFVIPLDSYLQVYSPDKKRGQVIAASNFLSFSGVLLASYCLYLFNEDFALSPSQSFGVIGFLTLFFQLIVTGRLSDFFFPYFARNILTRFYPPKAEGELPKPGSILIIQNTSRLVVWMVFSLFDGLRVLFSAHLFRTFPYFNGWLIALRMIKPDKSHKVLLEHYFDKAKDLKFKEGYLLLVINKKIPKDEIQEGYKKAFGAPAPHLHFIDVSFVKKKFSFAHPFRKSEIHFHFHK